MPQSTHNDDGRWIAAETVAPNETYVGNRLMYQRYAEVEHGLADVADGLLAIRILRRTAVGVGVVTLIFLTVALADGTVSKGVALAWFLVVIAWIAVSMLLPVVNTLSQWHLLLDGKAALTESAYAVVLRSLRDRHQIPAVSEVRRLRVGPPVPGVRNFLLVRLATYQIYVSVFAFGQDLFLGWTLRQRQTSGRVVVRWVVSQFRPDSGFDDLIDIEPVKALRDAVHNALRESIETAARNQQITIAEALGYPIEVSDHDAGAHNRPDW